MIHTIIWDFNGTVLDDLNASVNAVNKMLAGRRLALITKRWYLENLDLPLELFYKRAGFDMGRDAMTTLSIEFQQACLSERRNVFPEVWEALYTLQRKGYRQFLFSSLPHDLLVEQAQSVGVHPFFEAMVGRADHSLGTKEQAAKYYLEKRKIPPQTVLFVGDLITDWEMADYVGSPCVLIPKGHQSAARLRTTGATLLTDASELEKFLEVRR